MKILYLGNFDNPYSDATEKHIRYALLQLGHEVEEVNEKNVNPDELVEKKCDLFLFHKGGMPQEQLLDVLQTMTCKKAMWYFDKVWGDRLIWMDSVVPFIDYAFLTDESWVKRHNLKNTYVVRQGIGNENASLGKYNEKYANEIAFLGSVYGQRKPFVEALMMVYGDKFCVRNDIFGRKLYDFCASTKIIVAPKFPQDDFYWSSRVYMILGSGGFLIHPKLYGLQEEFEDGKHLVMYNSGKELGDKINYYLKHPKERKKIQMAGYQHCIKNYTYLDRVKLMMKIINEKVC